MNITARIDANNEFLERGEGAVGTVDLPRNPDPRVERYSGDPQNPFARKSDAEIATADLAGHGAQVTAQFDASLVIKSALIVALWQALGHQPTPAEIATARTRFVAVYKALS